MCHFTCSRAHALPSNSDFSLSLLFQCRFLYVVAQVIKNKPPQIALSWITLTPTWVFNRVETFTPTAPASLSNVSRNKSSNNSYRFRGNSGTVETHLNWVWYSSPFPPNLWPHTSISFFVSTAVHGTGWWRAELAETKQAPTPSVTVFSSLLCSH